MLSCVRFDLNRFVFLIKKYLILSSEKNFARCFDIWICIFNCLWFFFFLYPIEEPGPGARGFTRDPSQLQGSILKTSLRKSPQGFGFTIIGGDRPDEFLQVKNVLPDGPAAHDNKIASGKSLRRTACSENVWRVWVQLQNSIWTCHQTREKLIFTLFLVVYEEVDISWLHSASTFIPHSL